MLRMELEEVLCDLMIPYGTEFCEQKKRGKEMILLPWILKLPFISDGNVGVPVLDCAGKQPISQSQRLFCL